MKQIANTTMIAPGADKPFTITMEEGVPPKDARVSDLVRLLVQRLPVKTMAEAEYGVRVLDATPRDEAGEILNLEDADYSWLMKMVDEEAPKLLGLMAVRLRDALQPMSVAERKEQRNGAKGAEQEAAPAAALES